MTSVRPEHDGAEGDPYGTEPYGADPYARPGAYDYEAAVEALADPLTDPLPGQQTGQQPTGPETGAGQGAGHGAGGGFEPHTSPWFRPHQEAQPPPQQLEPPPPEPQQTYPPQGYQPYEPAEPYQGQPQQPLQPQPQPQPQQPQPQQHYAEPAPVPEPAAPVVSSWAPTDPAGEPVVPRVEWGRGVAVDRSAEPGVSETAAFPVADPAADPAEPAPAPAPARSRARTPAPRSRTPEPAVGTAPATADDTTHADADSDDRTVGLRRPDAAELGRAARRKAAAKGRGGKGGSGAAPPVRAGTRLEARRAARAAKDGPVVILSRFIGEVFITFGVLMLLFVAYQLWWTNVLAHKAAGKAADDLEDRWKQDPERKPGKFSAGEGFAIMYIPKLDIRVPVAEGVSKQSVLDKGMVGHYDKKSGLNTAMPWDKKGNFSVAGHRNTHGEPFRYINKLEAGDVIIVETADTYYTYKMSSRLASTSPSNTTVVQPVPPQSGFTKPGRYVTLTTCTPEFTSKYRLIVWGKMVDERPRSKGKPDALVG